MNQITYLIVVSLMFGYSNAYDFIYDATSRTKLDAKNWCISAGASQASISNGAENTDAMNYCSGNYCWIGLERQGSGSDVWAWNDGNGATYRNWCAGENDNLGGNENCVFIYADSGCWGDHECSITHYTLCNPSTNTPEPVASPTETPAPNSDVDTDSEEDSIYFAVNKHLTWVDAEQYCNDNGLSDDDDEISNLGTIDGPKELKEAQYICSTTGEEYCWIGLYGDLNNNNYFWTGNDDTSDNTKTTYWLENQQCAKMSVTTGQWIFSNCDEE
eukprot:748090_1